MTKHYTFSFPFSLVRIHMMLSNYSGSKPFRLSLSVSPAVLNWRSTAALVAGIEWICLASLEKQENSLALFSQNVTISDENSSISIFIDKYLLSSSDCVTGNEYSMSLTSSSPLDSLSSMIMTTQVEDYVFCIWSLYDRKRPSFVVLSYYLCPYYDHISSWPYTEKNNGRQRNTKKNGHRMRTPVYKIRIRSFFSPYTVVFLPIRHGDIRS